MDKATGTRLFINGVDFSDTILRAELYGPKERKRRPFTNGDRAILKSLGIAPE